MRLLPVKTLLLTSLLVVSSTALLPSVTGYGTILFQLVAFSAWSLVAHLTSSYFADTHHPVVWCFAAIINLLVFLVPALGIAFVARPWRSPYRSLAAVAWCAFYLFSLLWLFPATTGP